MSEGRSAPSRQLVNVHSITQGDLERLRTYKSERWILAQAISFQAGRDVREIHIRTIPDDVGELDPDLFGNRDQERSISIDVKDGWTGCG
jgi:hypothetical protein